GLSMILAEPTLSRTSCGMVVPTIGTVIMFRLATSIPLRMASVTSRAFPIPAPTRPFMSPTTISALNENLRPPLTTLATRLTRTTRSAISDRSPRSLCGYRPPMFLDNALKLQPCFSRGVGQRLDPSVVQETAAVEHDGADTCRPGLGRNRLADLDRLGDAVAFGFHVDGRGRGQSAAGAV